MPLPTAAPLEQITLLLLLLQCVCTSSTGIECMHICMDYVVREHSLKLQMLRLQYRALFLLNPSPPFSIELDIFEDNGGIVKSL